jgi:hypothetical protein
VIDDHRCGEFAAGENKITDGDFVGDEMLGHALVHSFVASAEQNHAVQFRKSPRAFLPKHFSGCREQDDCRSIWRAARSESRIRSENIFDGFE